jgi:DNA-binding Lrp family transcriptional regulator
MIKAPEKVNDAFQALKGQYDHIYLKKSNENFYVYKHTYEWQPDTRKSRTIAEYIGKITQDGTFVRRMVSYKNEFEKAKALIAARGGKIIWRKGKEQEGPSLARRDIKVNDVDLKLLMALSMNARMPASKLASLAGITEPTVTHRVKILEEKLGIKYLLEIDVEKLGFTRYVVLIKFEAEMPTMEELKDAIAGEPLIQFAATIKGDYDVIMYMINEDPLTASNNLFKLRTKPSIKGYRARWNLIYFAEVYSFMPLREEFIENVLKDRVWHRTKDAPRPDKSQLRQREYTLLKELNSHSTANFAEVDKKYNLNRGTSRYTYQTLMGRGIIIRPTLSFERLPMNYLGIIMMTNIDEGKIQDHRHELLLDEIEYGKISNKYSLIGNIGAPNGGIIFLPITAGSIEKAAETIDKELRGSIVRSLVVTDIITGALCHRRFDNAYSRQYNILTELKKIESAKLISYD